MRVTLRYTYIVFLVITNGVNCIKVHDIALRKHENTAMFVFQLMNVVTAQFNEQLTS